MSRRRKGFGHLATPIVVTVAWLAPTCSGAGGGLWQLGEKVDKNPITVFAMFVLTVIFTLVVEVSKHAIEHRTADKHRRAALGAIYAELMMVGLVSFCLILGAEVGLTEIKIQKPGCTSSSSGSGSAVTTGSTDVATPTTGSGSAAAVPTTGGSSTGAPTGNSSGTWSPTTATGSGTADVNSTGSTAVLPTYAPSGGSGGGVDSSCPVCATCSGSGSDDPCVVGFDLLMFEYAHLVLMWMGLTFCIFIQIAFFMRDSYVSEIAAKQKESTLHEHYSKSKTGWVGFSVKGIMGIGNKDKFARSVLVLRSALILQLSKRITDACDLTEETIRRALFKYSGKPAPAPMPKPEEALERFDMSRFSKIAMSEVLLELIHVPPSVWLCIIGMSTTNLIHDGLGVDLAYMTLYSAMFGPVLGFVLLERMSQHMKLVVNSAVGHREILRHEFCKAKGNRAPENFQLPVPEKIAKAGREWGEKGEPHPWSELDGCCDDDSMLNSCDPLDPGALMVQMQVIIFATCFYVGTIMMLSDLVIDHVGWAVLIFCWILPLIPLLWLIPRSILIFALVHRGSNPPEKWIEYALKEQDDPDPDAHGHGHGGGGGGCCSCGGGGHDDKDKHEAHDDHEKLHDHHDEHDHGPSPQERAETLNELTRYLLNHQDVTASPGNGAGMQNFDSGIKDISAYQMSPSLTPRREEVNLNDSWKIQTPGSIPTTSVQTKRPHRPRQADDVHPLYSSQRTESGHPPPSRRRKQSEVVCPSCGSHRLVADTPGALLCQDCRQRVGVTTPTQTARRRQHRPTSSPRPGHHGSEMAMLSQIGEPEEIRSPGSTRRSAKLPRHSTAGGHAGTRSVLSNGGNGGWARATSGSTGSTTCTHCGSIHLQTQQDGSTLCGKCGRAQQWM
eukprot:Hpha_TRINITY_DN16203_c0_g8::TRINITY_DN16203_c0_g8_i1::g.11536::m.11536